MAYTAVLSCSFGSYAPTLANVRIGVDGQTISSGISAIANTNGAGFTATVTTLTDAFRGPFVFYDNTDATKFCVGSIGPEHELVDVKSSTLATAANLATAQSDLDIITGADGVNLLSATQASIDAIEADTNELQTDDVPGLIAALNDPTAGAIADAVWDESTVGHTTAGTFGEQVKTDIDDILTDTNELQTDDVPGLIAALNDLSAAEVNTEVDTALADIHLDHLLAVDYDPASKPGTATALLNELIEDDAGESRFTTNALEQGPSGGGASAATIADAVWDEALADHLASGSTGEALNDIESDVWTYATRTLTSSANVTASSLSGSRIEITRDVTFTNTWSGLTIPGTWTKAYLTIKSDPDTEGDASSKVQVVVSNPAAGGDGLLYLNGSAATASEGSLTVDDGAGTIDCTLSDEATDGLQIATNLQYDLKVILSTGVSQLILRSGLCDVVSTPTRTI